MSIRSDMQDAGSPVEHLTGEASDRGPESGVALCLSGGGYRAMVFHAGVLWRLYEAGLLKDIKRVSSVSGGSITAAVLALKWSSLSFEPSAARDDFVQEVIKPVRGMAARTIDSTSVIGGILLPGSIARKIAGRYRKYLFGEATLQDLPDDFPRFVINATNVQSGALWRFMKPYMRDWRVGEYKNPNVDLATAVAASSAFPPVLSPATIKLEPSRFTPNSGHDLQREPYTSKVILSDGGVYDNLGLETAYKRYRTILASDAGGQMPTEANPKRDWPRHSYRVLNVIDNQVRSLRKRQLISAYKRKEREGAYWGIRTDIADYKLASTLPCPHERTMELANIPTRLKKMNDNTQERLVNWGYAVCDAALRAHVQPDLGEGKFPYPDVGV